MLTTRLLVIPQLVVSCLPLFLPTYVHYENFIPRNLHFFKFLYHSFETTAHCSLQWTTDRELPKVSYICWFCAAAKNIRMRGMTVFQNVCIKVGLIPRPHSCAQWVWSTVYSDFVQIRQNAGVVFPNFTLNVIEDYIPHCMPAIC